MNEVIAVVAVVYCLLLMIRAVRWTAVLQQKEYRFDRFWIFVKSPEGIAELLRVVPQSVDLTRTGFKRPKLTSRVVVTAGLLGVQILGIAVLLLWSLIPLDSVASVLLLSLGFVAVLLCVPLLVALTAIPTSMIAKYQTSKMCSKASRLLAIHKPLVIGITGSYGKSSTKQLLSHILQKKYSVFATPKSYNTRYSVARSLVNGYNGQEIVILEYGAYGPGEIKRLTHDLPPDWAIITGFAPQHLGLFGSEEAIAKAKAELIDAVPNDGKVFINDDDSGVQRIVAATQQRELRVIRYSVELVSWLKRARLSDRGYLQLPQAGKGIETKLVGRQYLQTIAGVWAVAEQLGVTEKTIWRQLSSFKPSETFMQVFTTKSGTVIIDDGGTSNPRGFKAALALLSELDCPLRVLVTPGIVDLGEQSDGIHRQLAEQAWDAGVSEVLHVGTTGIAAFVSVFGPARVICEHLAVETTLKSLPSGSMVLIEGKMPGWLNNILQQL